jgi:tetratricopeptide (TPR) repeat protein
LFPTDSLPLGKASLQNLMTLHPQFIEIIPNPTSGIAATHTVVFPPYRIAGLALPIEAINPERPPKDWLVTPRSKNRPFTFEDLQGFQPRIKLPPYFASFLKRLRPCVVSLNNAGFFEDAVQLLNRELDIVRYSQGVRSPAASRLLLELGRMYHKHNDHVLAEIYMKSALAAHPLVYHADVARIFLALIEVAFAMNKLEDVAKYNVAARTIILFHYGMNHPLLLELLTTLASGFSSIGNGIQALHHLEIASQISFRILSTNHPFTTKCTLLMANECKKDPRLGDPIPYFTRALTVTQSMFSSDAPETAEIEFELAETYKQKSSFTKALEYARHSLETRLKCGGPTNFLTLSSFAQCASLLEAEGCFRDAIQMYEQQLAALKELVKSIAMQRAENVAAAELQASHAAAAADGEEPPNDDAVFLPPPELIEQIQEVTATLVLLVFRSAPAEKQTIIHSARCAAVVAVQEDVIVALCSELTNLARRSMLTSCSRRPWKAQICSTLIHLRCT